MLPPDPGELISSCGEWLTSILCTIRGPMLGPPLFCILPEMGIEKLDEGMGNWGIWYCHRAISEGIHLHDKVVSITISFNGIREHSRQAGAQWFYS